MSTPAMSSGPARAGEVPPQAYAAGLASLPGVGPAWLVHVLSRHAPKCAWEMVLAGELCRPARSRPSPHAPHAPQWSEAARRLDVVALWAKCRRSGIQVTWPGQPGYPTALLAGPSPAGVLFCAGHPGLLDGKPVVAIVGTRRCTPEGTAAAYQLGYELVAAGVCVVSGLALGIDGAAHAGALAAVRDGQDGGGARDGQDGGAARDEVRGRAGRDERGWAGSDDRGSTGDGEREAGGSGSTVGVAASGVDVVYPRRHAALWREMVRLGAVMSETPPGMPAQAWRFPSRNRIIAGLGQMVVVVESHATGGSWHTVDAALRRGIEVGAVPGSVHSAASIGTNTLLHEGATPVRNAQDVLDALGIFDLPRATRGRADGRGRGRERNETTAPEGRSGSEVASCGPPASPSAGRERLGPPASPPAGEPLAPLDLRVLAAIGGHPLCLDEIVERSGLPVTAVVVSLDRLEEHGRLTGEAGWWLRNRP